MTLFDHQREETLQRTAPLAAKVRPRSFDELVGQEHIVGPDKVLRRSIESDQVPSIVLWGPPGSGKTTLALIISSVTRSHFEHMSAVTAGVADLRRIAQESRDRLGMNGQRTILFVDEIHRFSKSQQDVILPHVEDGTLTFVGATTENPSFEVISPLLSRCRVFTLNPLTEEQVGEIVDSALRDKDRGIADMRVSLKPDARALVLTIANGDARVALNAIELAASATTPDSQGDRTVTLVIMEDALQRRSLMYDKKGDQHYDTISAFIKSVRASDPDAAIYWMGRMVEAGEDPMFIARRLVILAAEDIGMADPQALPVAVAAQQAVHLIGMPESAIILAEATVYLATAHKSNAAYMALNKAREDIKHTRNDPVPLHLRNPVTGLMKDMAYGKDYKYAHNSPGHFAGQRNLPDNLTDRVYYNPSDQGYEKEVAERIRRWWGERKDGDAPPSDKPKDPQGSSQ
jgi:putative ATPase